MRRKKPDMRSTFTKERVRPAVAAGPCAWLVASFSMLPVLVSTGVQAQELIAESSPPRAFTVQPRFSVSETWTDKVQAGNAGSSSDQIMEISPGIQLRAEGGRLKGYLDYALNQLYYAKSQGSDRLQNSLNAFGTLEAVEKYFFIDVNGNISQQSVSALGAQSALNTLINPNQTEVVNLRISPRITGNLASLANYEARWSRTLTDSKSSLRSGLGQTDWLVTLSGDTPVKGLGWTLDSSRQTVGFSEGRTTEADLNLLGLGYLLTPQLSVTANKGVELSNYSSQIKENFSNSGFGFNWRLSDRTTFSGSADQRSFGRTHRLDFSHRTGRTAWKISDAQSISTTPGQSSLGSIGSVYDILFSQFATLEPNALARAQLVNAYLQINNLNPNTRVLTPFLSSAQTLNRQQELLFALLGVRSTLTFIASQTRSQRLDTLSSAVDDYSTQTQIQQQGLSINFSHRLRPDLSLSALGSWQKIGGTNASVSDSTSLLSLNLSRSLAKNSTISTSWRHVISHGLSTLSRETAFTININLLF
jgi:uncharacterized protein (PEP-CTERM system associated)